jgi:hypothetical protein
MYESTNFGTKFSLRGRDYNIPGLEVTKKETTDVCIAFMHEKIWEIFALLIKTYQSD